MSILLDSLHLKLFERILMCDDRLDPKFGRTDRVP